MTDATDKYAAMADEATQSFPGLQLDWTPASPHMLDTYLDHGWGSDGLAPDAESWQPPQEEMRVIVLFGSYVGELLRRSCGGAWQEDPARLGDPLFARVEFAGGQGSVWPIGRLYKRLKDGAAEAVGPYFDRIRRQVGFPPSAEEAQSWLRYAYFFVEAERFDIAARFFGGALTLAPDFADAWFGRAEVLYALGRTSEAVDAYERFLELADPSEADLRTQARERLAALGQTPPPEVVDHAEGAGLPAPAPVDAPGPVETAGGAAGMLLGDADYDDGDGMDVIEPSIPERGPDEDPGAGDETDLDTTAEALLARALAAYHAGDSRTALNLLARCTKEYPKVADAWLSRANLLLNDRQLEAALICYDHALQLAPDNAHTWHARGLALMQSHRFGDAVESFERTLVLAPDEPGTQQALAAARAALARATPPPSE